jgi:hypothetical protein
LDPQGLCGGKMISSKTLQSILETSNAFSDVSPDKFELLRKRIYEISMHAFQHDILTLTRMRSVIHTIHIGVTERAKASPNLINDNVENAQRYACQGLCSSAGIGLTAAGLAYTQFSKFYGPSLHADIGESLMRETLALKEQLDQVTRCAGWLTNTEVIRLQAHGFEQLMQPVVTHAKHVDESCISWPDRFFKNSGYKSLHAKSNASAKSNANASLMLLGLLTSGALIGLREAQAAV